MGRDINKRIVYLEDKPRLEAKEEMLGAFQFSRENERIQSQSALGRITAVPIFSQRSMPHYHASAMDGIAVVAEETYTAHEQNPLILQPGEYQYVDTGNAVPSPFNAVIMIENIQELDEGIVEIIEPATPWQHIRPIGEDITEEEMLFAQGHRLKPADIGALLAGGVTSIEVVKKPSVTIIPTGNELIQPGENPGLGKLIEFNGTVFANFIQEWGGEPRLVPIMPDDPVKIKEALLEATEHSDFVIINAGSSAGSKDFTYSIISQIGEVFTHGVACRPGKPVIIGKVNGKIVLGIPGYPVSAYLALEWFARPLVCAYLGIQEPKRPLLKVKLGRRVVSTMGAEEFVRMNVGLVNNQYIATPLARAAGVTMSYVRADALLVIPAQAIGLEQGEEVEVELMRPLSEINHSLVFNGSHDMTIDIIASFIKKKDPMRSVISTHTGSMAGIMSILKGEAHIAGIHLLDPVTGEYNQPYIQKFLTDQKVVIQPFLKRKQGWIVPKGNPLGIENIQDIVEQQADYVNRQKGAGTRILFDQLLRSENLSPTQVKGYQREYFSHLSVAAEVKGSPSSVGLGIYSAAKVMGLDFIPVADEQYELLMTEEFYESETGQELMELLRSEPFKTEVEKLGGYQVTVNLPPYLTSMKNA